MPRRLNFRAISPELAAIAASIVGLLPGFLLPFLSSTIFDVRSSDALLLAFSIYVLLTSVVGYSVEANTIAEYARTPLRLDFSQRRYVIAALSTGAACGLTAGLLLVPVYGSQALGTVEFFILAFPLVLAGVVAAVSAVFSGTVISQGRTWLAVSSQSLRTLPALSILLAVSETNPYTVSWTVLGGEALRCAVLVASARRYTECNEASATEGPWSLRGAHWQIVAATASQASPVVDRWFLSSGTMGSVTTYELADKVYFAAFQIVLSSFILRKVSAWRTRNLGTFEKRFRRDARYLGIGAFGLLPLAMSSVALLLFLDWLPVSVEAGLRWSMILLAGLPFAVTHVLCVRAFIALGKQSWLLPLTTVSVGSNVVLDYFLFQALGSIGIVWATLAVRVVVAGAYWIILIRFVFRRFGSPDQNGLASQDAELRDEGASNAV